MELNNSQLTIFIILILILFIVNMSFSIWSYILLRNKVGPPGPRGPRGSRGPPGR